VNKNTILAIFLILVVVTLFSTESYNKFFYENIFPRKPYIAKTEKIIKEDIIENQEKNNTRVIKDKEEKESTLSNKVESDLVTEKTEEIEKFDTVFIETDKIIMAIKEKGANIISVKMKNFKYTEEKSEKRKKGDLIDLIPENIGNVGVLKIKEENFNDKIFKYNKEIKKITLNSNDEQTISFVYKNNEFEVQKNFIFKNGTYKVGLEIKKNDLAGQRVELKWECGIEESEKNKPMQPEIRSAHYSDGNKQSMHFQMSKEEIENASGEYKWVGITSKYFFAAIVNDRATDADISIESFKQSNEVIGKNNHAINYKMSYSTIADKNSEYFWLYLGPNEYDELKKHNLLFDNNLFPVLSWAKHILFSDKWFPSLAEAVLWLLLKLNTIVKDYGISILILTFIVKLVTYPMTYSSMKSMSKMKDIQPKIQQLREKLKNNPKKMNEEMMALYKKEGVNPLNPGCLPMFLQMPIFISLFVVLRKAIELRGTGTVMLPWIKDLSKPEVVFQLPWSIPMYGDNFAILPIIMALLTYFQNKMTIKDPNQKMMIYFMPIFMLVLFNSFSAGLVLYWTLSSAFAIVQQVITDKQMKKITAKK